MKYGLLLPFNDESQSFRDGFEVGSLFEKVRRGEELKQYLIQSQNRNQVEKIFIRAFYEYPMASKARD